MRTCVCVWMCVCAVTKTKMNPRVQKLWHLISINTSQCESRRGMQSSCNLQVEAPFMLLPLATIAAAAGCCCCGCCKCCTLSGDATCNVQHAATCGRRAAFILLWNGFCHLFIAFAQTNEIWLKCVPPPSCSTTHLGTHHPRGGWQL